MRELKFRYVYKHRETGEIRTEVFDLDEIEIPENAWRKWRKTEDWIEEGFELIDRQQCTSLKDKNGKEIYEGDNVKATLRLFDIVDQKCRVIFHNGSFGLQYGYSLDYFTSLATWDDIEVIGNIYNGVDTDETNG